MYSKSEGESAVKEHLFNVVKGSTAHCQSLLSGGSVLFEFVWISLLNVVGECCAKAGYERA